MAIPVATAQNSSGGGDVRLTQSARAPFEDYAHFNDHGAAVAAGAIAETVTKALEGRPECR